MHRFSFSGMFFCLHILGAIPQINQGDILFYHILLIVVDAGETRGVGNCALSKHEACCVVGRSEGTHPVCYLASLVTKVTFSDSLSLNDQSDTLLSERFFRIIF